MPSAFDALLALSVTVNATGWAWGAFEGVWGYDEIAHGLGTLAMTLIAAWYGYARIRPAPRLLGSAARLGAVMSDTKG